MTLFADRVRLIAQALAEVPHAFGGAIALAYYAEPRATIDIDLNIFVGAEDMNRVERPLEALGVAFTEAERKLAVRDGQIRVFWEDTAVDLFFSYDAFHDDAARSTRRVSFGDLEIDILGPSHLVVCKTLFDRGKDWVDIDAMIDARTAIDVALVMRWVGRAVGDTDPRYVRIASVLTRR